MHEFAAEYLTSTTQNEEELDYKRFVQKFRKLANELPERRREIFLLRYQQELKNGEIAQRLSLSEQFVKNQLSIARKFLLSAMSSDREITEFFFFFLFHQ